MCPLPQFPDITIKKQSVHRFDCSFDCHYLRSFQKPWQYFREMGSSQSNTSHPIGDSSVWVDFEDDWFAQGAAYNGKYAYNGRYRGRGRDAWSSCTRRSGVIALGSTPEKLTAELLRKPKRWRSCSTPGTKPTSQLSFSSLRSRGWPPALPSTSSGSSRFTHKSKGSCRGPQPPRAR